MLNTRTILTICIILGVIIAWSALRKCSTSDNVDVHVPAHRIITSLSSSSVTRDIPRGVDSVVVARIIHERDSLRLLLRNLGVRERVRYDTVIVRQDGGIDSVIVECDEIRRTAHANIVVGERTMSVSVPSSRTFGLFAEGGASYVFSTSAVIPRLSMGARLHFSNDLSLVASGDLLIHGVSLQPAATLALRLEL